MDAASRRTRIVMVRMSTVEHADAVARARGLGVSMSQLLRSRAEDLPPARTDLAVAAELHRIGININQIAHGVNAGLAPKLSAVMPILDDLRSALIALRAQLRRR